MWLNVSVLIAKLTHYMQHDVFSMLKGFTKNMHKSICMVLKVSSSFELIFLFTVRRNGVLSMC